MIEGGLSFGTYKEIGMAVHCESSSMTGSLTWRVVPGVWLIQADSQDVGHVVVTLCYSMEYGGLIAFVALTEVRAFCANRGFRALFVETGRDNAAALAVYRRVGFVNTDRLLLALRLADPRTKPKSLF